MSQPTASVPGVQTAGSVDPATLERAHQAMMDDKALQHSLPAVPPPKPPPEWIEALAKFFQALGPVFNVLLWIGAAIIVGLLLYYIARELFGVRLGWSKKGKAGPTGQTDWRPDREKARVLLLDADALAAEGRYDEAVHMLLLRGVAEIMARKPQLIGPALTSRDIAALPGLPEVTRPAFIIIADIVERSLFGGQPVDEAGWLTARAAYERLFTGPAA
jgi:hypothetical protein